MFTLTRERDTTGAEGGGYAASIVAVARPATVLVRARGLAGTSFGSGVVSTPPTGSS